MSASTGGNGEMMIYVIQCDCGVIVKGDVEVELLSNAREHIDEAHPEMLGVSDEDLLANAKLQPAV